MDNKDNLWNKFAVSGKVNDYLAYCSIKEGNRLGNDEGTHVVRRTGSERNECRGER